MDTVLAATARRFPLAARTRPAATPLAERVAGLCQRAQAAEHNSDTTEATAVFNLAALLASDLDMPDLARNWCHRHVTVYLKAPRVGPSGVRCLLEPLINLARLHVRAGEGERAATLVHDLYHAVDTRTDTVIDGIELPTATMTGDDESHQEIRRWLWAVMLATTARALASIGKWSQARDTLERDRGIGHRMLDGRQIAVLERLHANDPDGAAAFIKATEPGEPWEHIVTCCLATLATRCAGRRTDSPALFDAFGALPESPGLTVFRTRLGLAVIDALGGPEAPACRDAALALVASVRRSSDGYAARDLLTHGGYTAVITDSDSRHLADRVRLCGLGQRSLPHQFSKDLAAALDTCESVISRTAGSG